MERNSEIHQAVNCPDIVVAVQRGDNQMPGLGGVHGDLGGLLVADFSDADHIGILAQGIAEQRSKCDIRFDVDLHLADGRHDMFNGILN